MRPTPTPTPTQSSPSTPIVDDKVEFARIIEEGELQQIKMINERSEAAMNEMVPAWYNTPNKVESEPAMINEPLKEKPNIVATETPER
jgi:hypothetical protein